MKIDVKSFSFVSKYDDVPIRGICYIPEEPIGIIQMVHGMCEHKERYHKFMKYLAEHGFVALMHDNRGHGTSIKSELDLGYCYESMEMGFVEDIYRVTVNIRKRYPKLPLVLYGHSMGSLAVRAYLREHDDAIDGLIVAGSPSYNRAVPMAQLAVTAYKRRFGWRYRSTMMQHLVLGNFEKPFAHEGRTSAWLAANEEATKEYVKDPLNTFTYTLNGFLTLLNLESIVYKKKGYQMKNPQLPILFVSGDEDPCYLNDEKWEEALERMQSLGYENVEAIRYVGMRHEIHNEVDCEKVFTDILNFAHCVLQNAFQ